MVASYKRFTIKVFTIKYESNDKSDVIPGILEPSVADSDTKFAKTLRCIQF